MNRNPLFFALPALLWLILFFCIPLCVIIYHSLLYGLSSYWNCLNLPYMAIIARSVILAIVTASCCTLLAFPIAYYIAQKNATKRLVLLFLVMLPFSVNILIQSYSWFFMLSKAGIINSMLLKLGLIQAPLTLLNTSFAVYLGTLYCYSPFAILPLYAVLEKLDMRHIEASLDLGATWYITLRHIVIPIALPGIITSFFLVLIPVFGEFVLPMLLGGNKQMFVGSLITYLFLTARDMSMGPSFTCLSSLILLGVTISAYKILKRVLA